MPKSYADKVVLITGAAGGMGRAFATRFAAEGAALIVTDIDEAGLTRVVDELRADDVACFAHRADLTSERDISQLSAAVSERYGRLDVLINNGGLAYGEIAHSFETLSQTQWLRFLSVNTVAPLLLAQALRPALAAARGSVINVSSMASYMPGTAYGVTKAALNAMTYGMAGAFGADGIRVNAIAPGIMETPAVLASLPPGTLQRVQSQQMLGLRGTADDIAELALFLASEAARFITCEIISCDAGNRMRGWR
ncbi:MAG: SDR family oxidoreductase [Polyangiales bacterium]